MDAYWELSDQGEWQVLADLCEQHGLFAVDEETLRRQKRGAGLASYSSKRGLVRTWSREKHDYNGREFTYVRTFLPRWLYGGKSWLVPRC